MNSWLPTCGRWKFRNWSPKTSMNTKGWITCWIISSFRNRNRISRIFRSRQDRLWKLCILIRWPARRRALWLEGRWGIFPFLRLDSKWELLIHLIFRLNSQIRLKRLFSRFPARIMIIFWPLFRRRIINRISLFWILFSWIVINYPLNLFFLPDSIKNKSQI